VILDEADNIHGNYDRGGASAITELVKESGQPIVLIANDYYDMARGLRNATQEIEFRDVSARSIVPVLRDICRKEGIEFESDALERIAERNRGDLRGAINDLQAATEGRDSIAVEDVVTGDRDKALGLFPYLDAVLKEESAEEALQSAYAVDETPDDLTKWIENNVLDVYDPSEVVRAYDFLANADVWLGRVRATQNYSYWRYATDNAAAGVAAARDGTKGGWTRYGRPQFWSPSDATADEVVGQIAAKSGCSVANRASRGAPVSGGGHPPLQAPRADGRDGGRLRPRRGGNRLRHRLRRIDEQGGVDRRRRAGAPRGADGGPRRGRLRRRPPRSGRPRSVGRRDDECERYSEQFRRRRGRGRDNRRRRKRC